MQFTDRFVCSSWRREQEACQAVYGMRLAVLCWHAVCSELSRFDVLARKLLTQFACQDRLISKGTPHANTRQQVACHKPLGTLLASTKLGAPTAANEPVSELHSFFAPRLAHALLSGPSVFSGFTPVS